MKQGRKISGGRYIQRRKKKSYEIAGQKRIVKIGEEKKKTNVAKQPKYLKGAIRTRTDKEQLRERWGSVKDQM